MKDYTVPELIAAFEKNLDRGLRNLDNAKRKGAKQSVIKGWQTHVDICYSTIQYLEQVSKKNQP